MKLTINDTLIVAGRANNLPLAGRYSLTRNQPMAQLVVRIAGQNFHVTTCGKAKP